MQIETIFNILIINTDTYGKHSLAEGFVVIRDLWKAGFLKDAQTYAQKLFEEYNDLCARCDPEDRGMYNAYLILIDSVRDLLEENIYD